MTASVPRQLLGFDPQCRVYVRDEVVLRGILPGHEAAVDAALSAFVAHGWRDVGITDTWRVEKSELAGAFPLVLSHPRVPFITYPHEWPADMLRDAAIFQADLLRRLAEDGWTLKDAHPYNILFDGTRPLFIDFTSLIPTTGLPNEPYLIEGLPPPRGSRRIWSDTATFAFEVYRRTFLPFFLHPLVMMERGDIARARRRLFETTMNASVHSISRKEAYGKAGWRHLLGDFRLSLSLARSRDPLSTLWVATRERLRGMHVMPPSSAYKEYYAAKAEDVPHEPDPRWTRKHHAVYNALKARQPRTVLDIGCNTGWYSILASKLGARVVAFDIDEASVNELYRIAKADDLLIQPLVMDFLDPTPDVWPLPGLASGPVTPLLSAAPSRLKCELVMVLALIHHLVLGRGHKLSKVIDALDRFVGDTLVIEFVAREDEKVVGERTFFPAYDRDPSAFEDYSLETCIGELKGRFASVESHPSFPSTRTILVCRR